MVRRRSRRGRGPGQDPHLWYFLLCYAGKGSLRWVLCQETFCERAEAAARREAACGAARRLPAREVVARGSSSALLLRQREPAVPSGSLFRARVLPRRPSAKPYLFAGAEVGRRGQAARRPRTLGREGLDTNPAGSSKGTGISPLVLPQPGGFFWGGGSEPAPPAPPPRLARSRGELDVHSSPQIQTPPHTHTRLFIPDSQRRSGF